jgi:hypothetical protein
MYRLRLLQRLHDVYGGADVMPVVRQPFDDLLLVSQMPRGLRDMLFGQGEMLEYQLAVHQRVLLRFRHDSMQHAVYPLPRRQAWRPGPHIRLGPYLQCAVRRQPTHQTLEVIPCMNRETVQGTPEPRCVPLASA